MSARPSRRRTLLSAREAEVVLLLADGLNVKETAGRLFLSPQTVRTHVRNARMVAGARTATHLVAMYLRKEVESRA